MYSKMQKPSPSFLKISREGTRLVEIVIEQQLKPVLFALFLMLMTHPIEVLDNYITKGNKHLILSSLQ